MAEVFKAKSYGVEGFEKVIAIKRILPSMGEDREFIKMFIDEAKIVGQLAHANICQIFELGRTDGAHFIAMEYIWGKDLLQIQNRARKLKQPMPAAMAAFIVAKVLEGLDYAHKKRDALGRPLEIVHRDCSPQNVLISYEGEVKIIDFGIAKAASRSSKTQAGVLKGKFGYMSPEQVRGLPLDRRSDLFAAGTILYECLSGDRLFVGETDFSTLEKVRNVDIPRPRDVNPNIPEAVEKIILKALAKDSSDRYQWGSEMVGDLQRFLMSQENVFTAKTLATWLKDGFAAEVDRERTQHESFKKLGREGLIAGVPQAEAKLDVVEHLGEAGKADDPTMLGGPSFEDMVDENGLQVGPAPGSPAARGDAPEEFAEEGPTEIFGEISEVAPAPQAPAAGAPARRPPTGRPTPPPRPATTPPVAAIVNPLAPARAEDPTISPLGMPMIPIPTSTPTPPPGSNGRTMLGMTAPVLPGGSPYGQQPQPPQSLPLPAPPTGQGPAVSAGFPSPEQFPMGSHPQQQGAYGGPPPGYPVAAPDGSYGYLGPSSAPPGGDPYAQQQQPPPYGYQGQQPGYPYPSAGPGWQPGQQQPYPSSPGYPQDGGYPPGYGAPAPAQTAVEPARRKKKPSLAKDVMIGVGIAAIVLGAFAVVKFVVMADQPAAKPTTAAAATVGSIEIALADQGVAEVFINDQKRGDVVAGALAIGDLAPGTYQVRIARMGAIGCEAKVDVTAGQARSVPCELKPDPAAAVPTATIFDAGAVELHDAATAAEVILDAAVLPIDAATPIATTGSGSGSDAVATIVGKKPIDDDSGSGSGSARRVRTDGSSSGSGSSKVRDSGSSSRIDLGEPSVGSGSAKTGSGSGSAKTGSGSGSAKTGSGSGSSASVKPITGSGSGSAKVTGEGYLVAYTTPFAALSIDGAATGKTTPITPRAKIVLAAGLHKVTFTVGREKWTFTVKIEPGKMTTISKDLPVTQP